MATRRSHDDPINELLRSIPPIAADVAIRVADLHYADQNIGHAFDSLSEHISRLMAEQGYEDMDSANEGSTDLSYLLHVLGLIEDAGLALAPYVSKSISVDSRPDGDS